jgi:hypothetical protein
MLSGGEALESRAVSRAGDVLNALARRMPTVAHRKLAAGLSDVPLARLTRPAFGRTSPATPAPFTRPSDLPKLKTHSRRFSTAPRLLMLPRSAFRLRT